LCFVCISFINFLAISADLARDTSALFHSREHVCVNKILSAMNYYAYRMMIRTHEENVILKCRRVFQQFAVNMYVKVETERLAFIRFNQAKLRSEDYIFI